MGAQHIDANHCFDPFFRRQPIDKLLDRDPPARLTKIFDPPLHHRKWYKIYIVSSS
jgi:hypothetical protein